MEINLRKIEVDDSDFLYNLYTSRNPQDILSPINHKDQLKFVQDFIESNEKPPYEDWKIIQIDNGESASGFIGNISISVPNGDVMPET